MNVSEAGVTVALLLVLLLGFLSGRISTIGKNQRISVTYGWWSNLRHWWHTRRKGLA